jgi:ATP-dependent Clp protease ATP-binding subunit ClpC
MIMFEQFTDRARKTMTYANEEAQRLNQEHIGTEHILLGLVKEDTGVGATVLKNLGVGLERVRREVEKVAERGADKGMPGKLGQTPQAKKVIEQAILEARLFDRRYVGSGEMLLGLLVDPEGLAGRGLRNLGLETEQVRKAVSALEGKKEPLMEKDPELL